MDGTSNAVGHLERAGAINLPDVGGQMGIDKNGWNEKGVSSRYEHQLVLVAVWMFFFGVSLCIIGCSSLRRLRCSDFRFRWFPQTMHALPFVNVALPLVLCVL